MHSEVEARLWRALQDVEDPEIPISVVGMGLIVSLAYRPDERAVDLELTFTAMGCPAMDFIQDDIRERLLQEPEVGDVRIEVVWDPVWTRSRIREDDEDLALVSARSIYDEQPWVHMIIVPRSSIREAIRP